MRIWSSGETGSEVASRICSMIAPLRIALRFFEGKSLFAYWTPGAEIERKRSQRSCLTPLVCRVGRRLGWSCQELRLVILYSTQEWTCLTILEPTRSSPSSLGSLSACPICIPSF